MDPANLTDLQLDALREVTNIGCGSAATALSQLLDGLRVDLTVATARVFEADELAAYLNGVDDHLVGIHLDLRGVVEGGLMLLYPESHAKTLSALLARKTSFAADPSGMSASALMEVGNIVASAYLNAVGRVTGLMLLPSVPHLVRGGAEEVAAQLLGESGGERVLVLDTWMKANATSEFNGHVVIVPAAESIDVLLGTLGL